MNADGVFPTAVVCTTVAQDTVTSWRLFHVKQLPLEGVRVLDISTVLAAPLTCSLLGELGAEVIKVESPVAGDPVRSFPPLEDGTAAGWEQYGRGKQSIGIDLHHAAGIALVHELVGRSDVVVTNFRKPTLDRFGLDFDQLIAVRPNLVMLHLTAFGRTGPYSDRPGFARVVEAFSGLTHRTGNPDGPPMFSGYPIADGVGGIYGAFAIMAALRQRDISGESQLVDLALYEPLLRMMEDLIPNYASTGVVAGRVGNDNPAVTPNGLFRTRDDRWLVLPVSTDAMWRRLLTVMNRPDLAQYSSMEARVRHRDVIDSAVAEFVAAQDLADVLVVLHDAGLAAGPVNTAADIVADEQILARGSIVKVETNSGRETSVLAPAGRFSGFEHARLNPAPAIGQDTDDILAALTDFDAERIRDLRAQGVIR